MPPLVDEAVTQFCAVLVPVTVKEMLQEPATANVAPERVTDVDVAMRVPGGVQVFVNGVVLEIVIPLGTLSLNATPVRATVFAAGLEMVKVSVLVKPSTIVLGVKVLTIVGGATTLTQT